MKWIPSVMAFDAIAGTKLFAKIKFNKLNRTSNPVMQKKKQEQSFQNLVPNLNNKQTKKKSKI